jgi:hypothetical protein
MIDKNILIEDLIEQVPGVISYLMEQKIRCIRCGEPIWGTLEQAAIEKGYSQEDINKFVNALNEMIAEK